MVSIIYLGTDTIKKRIVSHMITTKDTEFTDSKYRVRVGVRGGVVHTVAGTDDHNEAKEFMKHILDAVTLHNHPFLSIPSGVDPGIFKQDFLMLGDMAIDMGDINLVCIESYDLPEPVTSATYTEELSEPYDILKGFYDVGDTTDTPTVTDMPMDDVVQE